MVNYTATYIRLVAVADLLGAKGRVAPPCFLWVKAAPLEQKQKIIFRQGKLLTIIIVKTYFSFVYPTEKKSNMPPSWHVCQIIILMYGKYNDLACELVFLTEPKLAEAIGFDSKIIRFSQMKRGRIQLLGRPT